MAQSTQQMTEWIRKGEPHKKIKQDIVVTTRTLENSSSWRLCTGCRRHRDVCSGVWFSVQNLLFVPHHHCFFFFNPEMYNDLSLEKCTFLCNLWAPGGLMNLCTYLCIANSIRSLFIFGIRKKSWNQEAQISSFPSLELKQMEVVLSHIQRHSTRFGNCSNIKCFSRIVSRAWGVVWVNSTVVDSR